MWKLKGYTVDAFDQTQVVYNVWANTKNDLPSTMTDIGYGTALGFGSTAQTFDDSKDWRWNGTEWVEQNSGQEIEISADDIVYDNTSSGLTATNVQDSIDELYGENENQQLEINYAINTGAKNLLKYDGRSSASTEGVTYTINADGTITVNGTPQGSSPSYVQIMLNGNAVTVDKFCDGHHILSGCPAGGSDSTYRLYVAKGSYSRFDYGDGVLLTDTTQTDIRVVVYIANGYTANNLVFSPMIRDAVIKSTTYEPYAPTNRELYETKITSEDVWGYGQLIPDSADLNDYTTGGKYYGGNSAGNTVLNLPVANGSFTFTLEVKLATPSMTYQYLRVCRLADDPYIYCRRRYNSWGSWYRFTGETVVTSTQSLNSTMTLNLNRNDLNEQLDSNFDLIDSIPEEEEGEEDV